MLKKIFNGIKNNFNFHFNRKQERIVNNYMREVFRMHKHIESMYCTYQYMLDYLLYITDNKDINYYKNDILDILNDIEVYEWHILMLHDRFDKKAKKLNNYLDTRIFNF
jgi:hypothetical protein